MLLRRPLVTNAGLTMAASRLMVRRATTLNSRAPTARIRLSLTSNGTSRHAGKKETVFRRLTAGMSCVTMAAITYVLRRAATTGSGSTTIIC
ncbi:hypothetical protein CHELA20_52149 [Hyphomicrobiales bacterium]|nr:hypothetical protein CHELA41_22772 [Hyphomicrobiales bacterium]CAH1680887.1 hypothetical protein CHELA20_52149 [Hyphomicrobiales bacterium]